VHAPTIRLRRSSLTLLFTLAACGEREPPARVATSAGDEAPRAQTSPPIAQPPSTTDPEIDAALSLVTTDPLRPQLLLAAAERWDARARAAVGDPRRVQSCGLEAARALRALVTDHPNAPRADHTLFLLGGVAARAERMDLARQSYLRLLQRYPNSPLVPYAYLAFGEFFRAQNDSASATQVYQRVTLFDARADLVAYARYRLAESYLAQDQCPRAMELFRQIAVAQDAAIVELSNAASAQVAAGCEPGVARPTPNLSTPEP
jgi:tetratricopeptide (TPR) repeat protein